MFLDPCEAHCDSFAGNVVAYLGFHLSVRPSGVTVAAEDFQIRVVQVRSFGLSGRFSPLVSGIIAPSLIMPEGPSLLGEPTTVDIPSGTADIVCGRRAEESDKLGDLLRGNKLLRRLFLG